MKFQTLNCINHNQTSPDKLDAFFDKVFPENGFLYEPRTVHNDLKNISAVFEKNGGSFWLLIKDETIVASAGLKVIDRVHHIGELKCMYVLEDMQAQGCGQKLLDKICFEAKLIPLNKIRLDVKVQANKAIGLYRKNGFYEIERYNDNRNDVLFMEKDLS